MTKKEFYEALEQKTQENEVSWYLHGGGSIRTTVFEHCPLSYLADESPCDVFSSAEKLGVGQRAAWAIARAADGNARANQKVRASLLTACGLA